MPRVPAIRDDHLARGALGADGAGGAVGAPGAVGDVGAIGAAGAAGVSCVEGAAPWSSSEFEGEERLVRTTSKTLVAKNATARNAVVRVSRLAVDRPVIKPDMPPPPMPSAPPSLFCSRMTPTSAVAIMRWMTRMTVIMAHGYRAAEALFNR